MSSSSKQRREYFRFKFPQGEELIATIDGLTFSVTEVSEGGMRVEGHAVPNHEGIVRGTIHWHDQSTSDFEGELGRTCGTRRVIQNITGIHVSKMVMEQRRLCNKYYRLKEDG